MPIPIVLYNIPSRTGVNLNPETIARLAEVENIVAVKEASGSIKQMSDVIRLCKEDFGVLSGDDLFTLPLMAMGGTGIISVVSNVAPADMAALVDAIDAKNMKKAKALHYKLSPLIDAMFIETNPVPVKAALAMMGKIDYEVRLPLAKLTEGSYEKLKKALLDYGLIKK